MSGEGYYLVGTVGWWLKGQGCLVIGRWRVFTLMVVAGRECWIVIVYGKSMFALRLCYYKFQVRGAQFLPPPLVLILYVAGGRILHS